MTPVKPPQDPDTIPPEYQILDAIDLGILLVDEDLTVVRANTAFRQLAGGEPGEVRAVAGDGIPEFECRVHAPDGRERRCRCSGRRVPPKKGWLLLFREMPGDYEAIVEYTGTATILIEGDGIITLANTEFERLSGYPRSEIIGMKRLTDFAASDEEREQIVVYHALRRREPGAAPEHYSFSFIDRSGTLHAVEVTIGLIPGTNRSVMSLLDVTGRKRAERALQESQERLNLALSVAKHGLVDWDIRTGTIFYSPRSFTMLGYEPGAFVPTIPSALALVHPEDRGRVEAVLADMASGVRDHCEMEFRMKSASGQWIDVLDRLQVIARDGSGAPVRVVGTHTDITGQKRAEQELLVRGMAMESSLAAIAIADLDGHLTYANRAFLSLWGYESPAEVLGRSVAEFWLDGRVLTRTGRYTGERIGRRRDGTTFCAIFSGNTVTGDAGVPIGLAASLIDITDLKRAETEVKAHNRMLSILNQVIGVSIAATDVDEMLADVLAATLALLDLPGGSIHLIEPEGRSARLACVQALPEGSPLHRCIPDITVLPFSDVFVAGKPLFFDGEGGLPPYAVIPLLAHEKVVGALSVVNRESTGFTGADRSLLTAIGREVGSSLERAMLIRQLEAAEREANLYLDILGHDIRNAENISGLYADLLVDALTGKEKEYAQRVRSSVRKSIDILRNVSTIRRIRHESASLSPIDLDEVLRDEIAIFAGCRIRYDGTGVMVMADGLLPEVFTNLIGNAVKFGGPEVEIAIRVEERGSEVVVVVEDTGPGVPDDRKEAVFMRFGPNQSKKSGQGLGLSITRMLVERYGGTIRVDDRIPGNPEEGAAFRFTLKKG